MRLPLHTHDETHFTLQDLSEQQCIKESEFYFPMNANSASELTHLLAEHRNEGSSITGVLSSSVQLPYYHKLKGMMHGFIDLIFEQNGQYFVCDYKSTFLGEDFSLYTQAAMRADIEHNHYDLQYLIYSLALHRYLAFALPDYDPQKHFGGIYYLYLRGVTNNPAHQGTGVYNRTISVDELETLDAIFSGEQSMFSQSKSSQNKSSYSSYALAKKEIATIEPIDYFFAKNLIQVFTSNNIAHSDQQRTELFHVLMALSQSLREGHICLPIKVIANTNYGYLSDDFGVVLHHGYVFSNADVINALLMHINVTCEAEQPIVYHDNKLYMRRYFQFEQSLFQAILSKNSLTTDITPQLHIKNCINTFFPETESSLGEAESDEKNEIDWQKIAVANALNKNFSVIAGGPGTGKTYTVTKLLAAFVYLHQLSKSISYESVQQVHSLKMALVAPTGKAAQRLSESIINTIAGFRGVIADDILDQIPSDTYTIHRLLGVIPNSPNFRFNNDNLLNIDILLIDEVSMVNLAMMNRVFRALPSHCKVVLLGDANQLPSVSAGSVLNDIAPRPFLGYSIENINYLKMFLGLILLK